MPVNIWSAGQDALLDFLAARDANRRLAEDRARRDRLDQEMAADRQRQREIQEENLRLTREDREERRAETKRVNDERIRASEEKRQQDERVQTLVEEMLDPVTPAERKQAIGFELDRLGVSPTLIDKYLNPKPTTKPVFGIDPRTGQVRPIGEIPADAHTVTIPKPESGPAAAKDDPSLPRGTKAWIESIALRGVPLEQARLELAQGWALQRAAHPNAELGAAADYLMKLYPQVPDELPTPRGPLGGEQVEEPPAAPQQPQTTHESLMASVPNGKRVKFSDGSVWEKGHDGSVRRVQ